jgi:hypothetical protein
MPTDKQIEAAYNQIRSRIDAVNQEYLEAVAEQIKAIGKLNPSSINRLAQMRLYGANVQKIKKSLADALDITVQDVQIILDAAAKQEYASKDYLAVVRGRQTFGLEYNAALQRYIQALAAQTKNTLLNFSQTTNMDVAYQEAVSNAIDAVSRGVTDYNSAIRDIMRKLGGDGLAVTYASGVTRRMDSAVRQNVIDGVRQVAREAQAQIGREIGADGVEISAHPNSAADHEPVQGKQFTIAEFEKMQSGQEFEDVDGNKYAGFSRAITQWNCRHFPSYIILGVSKRRYTDKQLAEWRNENNKGCEIDGKRYTTYEASQLMRKLETSVRKQKDIANLAKGYGDDVLRREAQAKIRDLKAQYEKVAKASGLKQRTDRMIVQSYAEVA